MSGKECSVLIVVEPGELRESLRAVLVSILPDIQILDAADLVTAESLIGLHHPSLVVIDGGLHVDRPTRLIETAHGTREHVRCFLLADSIAQQASALTAGAEHAVVKGEPAPRLFAQFEHFLKAA